jgi:very-short-patch-repair endonuclease
VSVNNSRWHRPQVEAILDELESLADRHFDGSVGVVTPFKEHARRIRDAAHERIGPSQLDKWGFLSATADKFQGDEKDVILFGLVGGGEGPPHQTTSRFYNEARRFNVAISRARLLLHVFGDSQWASTCSVEILQALSAACHAPEPDKSHVRAELIGPVWEPRLAKEMSAQGLEFSPQYEACGFYLDFALFPGEGRLINVEVDGETYHRDQNGNLREEDVRRDHILKANGWTVQRFWVYQLREDLPGCLNKIKKLMES